MNELKVGINNSLICNLNPVQVFTTLPLQPSAKKKKGERGDVLAKLSGTQLLGFALPTSKDL